MPDTRVGLFARIAELQAAGRERSARHRGAHGGIGSQA